MKIRFSPETSVYTSASLDVAALDSIVMTSALHTVHTPYNSHRNGTLIEIHSVRSLTSSVTMAIDCYH